MLPRNAMYEERFTGHFGHVWSVHSNDGCETCDMVNKRKVGGRLKRKQNIAECPKVITEHVQYQGQKTNVQSPSQQTVLPLPFFLLTVNKILEQPLTFVDIKFRSTNMTVL